MKELAKTMQTKASSNLEEMKSTISFQTASVENFLRTAVSEAKDVNCDIQNSLNEQRQLLAFSAQQQEERLHRALVSAQEISSATVDFFNDVSHRAFKLVEVLEVSQRHKSHQLAEFNKMFKEGAAREEQLAMQKIAATLAALTAKRTAMVSEASRNIEDTNLRENKLLLQEMFKMQQVSASANKELNEYAESVKSHFMEDAFTTAETTVMMDCCLEECTKKVDYSIQQWNNAEQSINHLNKTTIAEVESMLRENNCENQGACEQFVSTCSSMNAEYEAKSCDMRSAVNDSLTLDHETKKEFDSMYSLCAEQLNHIREKHGESILNIRNRAEQCLRKDYLVDEQTTPKKRVIAIPSLAAIEETRTTQACEDLIGCANSENRPKCCNNDSKIHEQQQQQQQQCVGASPNRTPFADVN